MGKWNVLHGSIMLLRHDIVQLDRIRTQEDNQGR